MSLLHFDQLLIIDYWLLFECFFDLSKKGPGVQGPMFQLQPRPPTLRLPFGRPVDSAAGGST